MSLRGRLAIISAVVFGLLIAATSLASYDLLARQLDEDLTRRLSVQASALHGYLRVDGDTVALDFDRGDRDEAVFVQEATRYYQVYDVGSGVRLATSPGLRLLDLESTRPQIAALAANPKPFDIDTARGRFRIFTSTRTSSGRRLLLQVAAPLAPLDAALSRNRAVLLWRTPVAMLLALAMSWWLSGFALRPLAHAAAVAGTIDVQTLDQRLPLSGTGDELDRVSAAFNSTLDRLARTVEEMRQFSAALAHELRTPLTTLRGQVELSIRAPGTTAAHVESAANQLDEIDRLTRLIDQILTLARAEAGQIRLARDPVDLSALAAYVVEQLEPVAAAQSLTLTCDAVPGVSVVGDQAWLQRLLLNLVGNAIKYTNGGGDVVVRVGMDGARARVDVEDTGVGLSAADAARVFDRFFRADPSRSAPAGAGLGLSLVDWIARRHHGSVTVASRPGRGSTFTVLLPALPTQTATADAASEPSLAPQDRRRRLNMRHS